jgi:hypothetical protein
MFYNSALRRIFGPTTRDEVTGDWRKLPNPEGNNPLGRPRRRWMANVKMDLTEIGWGGTDWIHLTQDIGPVEGSCEDGNEH